MRFLLERQALLPLIRDGYSEQVDRYSKTQ